MWFDEMPAPELNQADLMPRKNHFTLFIETIPQKSRDITDLSRLKFSL